MPEKVESILRKLSLIIPQIEDNPYRIMLNITLAGTFQDQETSESYLKDYIERKYEVSQEDFFYKFYALVNLYEMYLDEGEVEAALDLAINALKVIDLFGSSDDYLDARITLLQYIAKDYIRLKEFGNASSYFELLSKHINIRLSDEYKREYSRNTTINDDVTEIWRDITGAIIKVDNGSIKEGFTELNVSLDKVNEAEIPIRRHDLDFALIPLKYSLLRAIEFSTLVIYSVLLSNIASISSLLPFILSIKPNILLFISGSLKQLVFKPNAH